MSSSIKPIVAGVMGLMSSPMVFSLKLYVILLVELEFDYYNVTVQHVNRYLKFGRSPLGDKHTPRKELFTVLEIL